MLPFKLVYSDAYYLPIGDHVFPAEKYRRVHDRLISNSVAEAKDFLEPQPATDLDILLVHSPEYVQKLKTGTLSPREEMEMEIPYSRDLVDAFWLAAGGSILAGRQCLIDRVCISIGGGFHHAFPGHGEGFCAMHDVAVAIRALQHDGSIQRALIVDLDVHHGNGTAAIFAGDRSVLTLSMHQFHNYPSEKPDSIIDIHLQDGVEDEEYLSRLNDALAVAMGFAPNLVFYLAGADPYQHDQLGGLSLTMEGLKQRDSLVFDTALTQNVPVAVVLAGGYARNTDDTVTIHCNTARAAREALL